MSAKPTPPCVRALDADGSEFFMDARGLAWRADSSRVPELDGPPSGAPLDRAEVVRPGLFSCYVLHEDGYFENPTYRVDVPMTESEFSDAVLAVHGRKYFAVYGTSEDSGCPVESVSSLRAEFDAACKEVGRG